MSHPGDTTGTIVNPYEEKITAYFPLIHDTKSRNNKAKINKFDYLKWQIIHQKTPKKKKMRRAATK